MLYRDHPLIYPTITDAYLIQHDINDNTLVRLDVNTYPSMQKILTGKFKVGNLPVKYHNKIIRDIFPLNSYRFSNHIDICYNVQVFELNKVHILEQIHLFL